MRNKTISLCPTTYELANKMENFSQWIRRELRKTRDPEQMELDFALETISKMQGTINKIKDGRLEWVSPHGWMKCGEEE